MSKKEEWDDEPCRKCNHPKGCHDPVCWSHGLVEPKCSKKCMKFERDNLVFLEREFIKKAHKKNKKTQRETRRYSRGNAKGLSFV